MLTTGAGVHGRTAPGVPRWAARAAYAVPLTVLPSSVWRIAAVFDDGGRHGRGDVPEWMPMLVYVIVLSLLSELLAFTAVGLVATWGEVWPRWIPFLAGRQVPVFAAVIPAALAGAVLTAVVSIAMGCIGMGVTVQGEPLPSDFPTAGGGWPSFFFHLAYLPLLLWGPLLVVLTVHYHRRRSREPSRA